VEEFANQLLEARAQGLAAGVRDIDAVAAKELDRRDWIDAADDRRESSPPA